MIIREIVTKEIDTVTDIRCDFCGQTCRDSLDMNFEYATVKAHWGYGSRKDGTIHEAHFCEKCFDAIEAVVKLKGGSIPSKEGVWRTA